MVARIRGRYYGIDMNTPFIFPDVLLPDEAVSMKTWPVIACDQFTADQSYWDNVESIVGSAPSTLRLILPEIYLEGPDQKDREDGIRRTMQRYLDEGVFQSIPKSAVYVRRELGDGTLRRGLVVAVDLDAYDFDPSKRSLIRASEQTIPERLPPRASIRRGAAIESPHVLVLFDDPEDSIMSYLETAYPSLPRLYDTPLMLDGGRIEGFRLSHDSTEAKEFVDRFDELTTFENYGYLMATGDGNHSLAAAKSVWEERKREGAGENDPFRYCLVELVNVYDQGLPFHPIHRLFEGDETALIETFLQRTNARFHGFKHRDLHEHIDREGLSPNEIGFLGPNQAGILSLPVDAGLAVAIADDAVNNSSPTAIDYVHGLDEVIAAADDRDGVAVILPEIDRGNLFSTVARKGALPRKAFSLGQARDKRYYLECRGLT